MDNKLFQFDKNYDDITTRGGAPSGMEDFGFEQIDGPPFGPKPPKLKWIPVVVLLAAIAVGGMTFFILRQIDEHGISGKIPEEAKEYEGHHYMLYKDALTWTEAKERCEEEDGHLATITSQEEQDFIGSYIEENVPGKMHYWLGGTDENNESEWEWVTGEDFHSYENWERGMFSQPSNNLENDPEHGEDYLEIQATYPPDNPGEYLTWNDCCVTGDAPSNAGPPWYYSNQYFGYICEWDE